MQKMKKKGISHIFSQDYLLHKFDLGYHPLCKSRNFQHGHTVLAFENESWYILRDLYK